MSATKSSHKHMKLVLLGDQGVGKSTLVVMYCQGMFVEKYDPTIEDAYRKPIEIREQKYMLEILDTVEQRFTALRDLYFKQGHGFMFLFDCTRPATLDSITNICKALFKVKNDDWKDCLIVATKTDLKDKRQVTSDQGEQFARTLGPGFEYMETSSKLNEGVNEVFGRMIELMEMHGHYDDEAAQQRRSARRGGRCLLS